MTRPDGRRVLPHVLELTFGVDRNLWALADVHLAREGERTVWRLPPYLAPVPVGVFPLIAKEHGGVRASPVAGARRRRAYPDQYRRGELHRETLRPDGRGWNAVLRHGRRRDAGRRSRSRTR